VFGNSQTEIVETVKLNPQQADLLAQKQDIAGIEYNPGVEVRTSNTTRKHARK
jgi:hypothetical protein